MLKDWSNFEWNDDCESAFKELKTYHKSPPLLLMPNEEDILQLYLSISDNAISLVLVRSEGNDQNLNFYVSKVLQDTETGYTYLEKLLYSLIISIKRLKPYFHSHTVEVVIAYPLRLIMHKPDLV